VSPSRLEPVGAVMLHPRAAADARFRVVPLPVFAVVIGDAGDTYIVCLDGGLDRVVQGGRPHGGIAEDAIAARRRG
jgi:hypothetical protein